MRVIINDQRYGALRTLGERKQVFNEVCVFMDEFRNSHTVGDMLLPELLKAVSLFF